MSIEKFENLDKVLEEVNRLKRGFELLEKLWFGGIDEKRNSVDEKLRWKIDDFFGIDNSE